MATAQLAEQLDHIVTDPEELEMQVRLLDDDGVPRWHRTLAGAGDLETACAMPIDLRQVLGRRIETCEGEMCAECFTTRELVKAHLATRAAHSRSR